MRDAICSVDGCEKPVKGRGWCAMHYKRWSKHGSPGGLELRREPRAAACSVIGCAGALHAKALCHRHYQRAQRLGSTSLPERPSVEDRFWERVEIGAPPAIDPRLGSCWLWVGGTTRGYGAWNGSTAHRFAYELLVGPIPDGLELDHLCMTRPCVRPVHLEPVTSAENNRRALAHRGGRRSSTS